jgi:hypothetical protein
MVQAEILCFIVGLLITGIVARFRGWTAYALLQTHAINHLVILLAIGMVIAHPEQMFDLANASFVFVINGVLLTTQIIFVDATRDLEAQA